MKCTLNIYNPNKKKTFLLVEDDPNDAYLVEMEFKKNPELELKWVKNGQEAMNYLEAGPPYRDRTEYPLPDVILLDLKMPLIGGFEFLRWHHKKSPNHLRLIPIIVMSGSDLQEDVLKAYELGANCYLTKPTDWNKFREQMERIGIFWEEFAKTPVLPGH